jgi:hypothetical protein
MRNGITTSSQINNPPMTDTERRALSVETTDLAKLAAELREAGRALEADVLAIRVAENVERLARP